MLGDYTQHDVVVQFIKDDPEFFTKFAALMNNDTTYLLDESLGKLKEIARLQNILEVPLAADASEQQRQLNNEQQNTLFSHERHVQTYLVLAAETVQFMHKITHRPEVIQQFMAPEIVFRVAAMLDYNLVALAGPKSSELKVISF
jgi:ubiquitin conjugation factor E4 B